MSGRATTTAGRWTTRRVQPRGKRRCASAARAARWCSRSAGAEPLRPIRPPPAPRWVGRILCLGERRPAGGSCRVPFPRRIRVRRAGMGLQRPIDRGGAGARPGGTTAYPGGPPVRWLRPWGCGRSVRSADTGGDSQLAVGARWSGDGVSRRRGGRGAPVGRRRAGGNHGSRRSSAPAACGSGGAATGGFGPALLGACRYGRARRAVLAVDHEQHESGGLRGVSAAVPERDLSRPRAEPVGGVATAGRWPARGNGVTSR